MAERRLGDRGAQLAEVARHPVRQQPDQANAERITERGHHLGELPLVDLGREAAKLLARGATVIVAVRNPAGGAKTVADIEAAGGRASFVAADMADVEAVRRLATEAGEVDVLVNNAAIFPFAPTIEQGIPDFDAMFDVNVRAPYFLTAALVPKMLAKGSGSIVDVTTIAAAVGMPGSSVYGASKAALESLARTAAPAGIAEVILFLASPRSSYLTSTTITADGGAIAV